MMHILSLLWSLGWLFQTGDSCFWVLGKCLILLLWTIPPSSPILVLLSFVGQPRSILEGFFFLTGVFVFVLFLYFLPSFLLYFLSDVFHFNFQPFDWFLYFGCFVTVNFQELFLTLLSLCSNIFFFFVSLKILLQLMWNFLCICFVSVSSMFLSALCLYVFLSCWRQVTGKC